jgi:hypothetical protein
MAAALRFGAVGGLSSSIPNAGAPVRPLESRQTAKYELEPYTLTMWLQASTQ